MELKGQLLTMGVYISTGTSRSLWYIELVIVSSFKARYTQLENPRIPPVANITAIWMVSIMQILLVTNAERLIWFLNR